MKNNTKQMDETTIKTMELYVSPMRERNLEKHGMHGDQCECCGRMMKPTESKMVHMGVDWMAYNTDQTTIIDGIEWINGTDMHSQGFFKIGNDCAKKMKGFTFEW